VAVSSSSLLWLRRGQFHETNSDPKVLNAPLVPVRIADRRRLPPSRTFRVKLIPRTGNPIQTEGFEEQAAGTAGPVTQDQ
jgi:hypothetical protein